MSSNYKLSLKEARHNAERVFDRRAVEQAIVKMTTQLSEPITVSALSFTYGWRRSYFSRKFAQLTGATPSQYLSAVRMQKAKRLLISTDINVTEVCFDVGYNSLGTFVRQFSSYVGLSPLAFRRAARDTYHMTIRDFASNYIAFDFRGHGTMGVNIRGPGCYSIIVAGIFASPVPKYLPIECRWSTINGDFKFHSTENKTLWIFAVGLHEATTIGEILLGTSDMDVGSWQIQKASPSVSQCVLLKPQSHFSPPLVLAFPLLLPSASFSSGMYSTSGEAA